MLLSVVVPCYNESLNLSRLHEALSAVCAAYAQQGYEILLVNDGSRDDTWQQIKALAAKDAHVLGINLSRNYGHQIALTAGLAKASGERVLIIDADLQDPPELLPEMMTKMDEGFDVVYGQRKKRIGETWFKKISAALYYRLLRRFSDVEIPLDTGDFRLLRRNVVDALSTMREGNRFMRGLVSYAGFRQAPVTYERAPRTAGESNYSALKMLRLAVDGLTSFSLRPLYIAFFLGVVSTLAGLAYLICIGGCWLVGEPTPHAEPLYGVLLTMFGIQWLFMGVMGEYIGRIYHESKQRPLYFVQETTR